MTKHINKLEATLSPTARGKTEMQMCGNDLCSCVDVGTWPVLLSAS